MGNLGRPGYGATTDGVWPYSYDSCDVGTFRNQTLKDRSGPAAALHSDSSRDKYNKELSWLTGQKLSSVLLSYCDPLVYNCYTSSCSCPNSDHPGPFDSSAQAYRGRGAPEIDILEAEKDKDPTAYTAVPANEVWGGHVVSQSAQFAPFTHDYLFGNAKDQWKVWDPSKSRPNSYRGSAVQQAVSGLSKIPDEGFQGTDPSTRRFVTYGFEYYSNPSSRSDGFITWQVDGKPTIRVGAAAMQSDPEDAGGTGVSQRLIPEEPMSIVLNLGMSFNWQQIDISTMIFPAEMLIDYVRVYQRKGQANIGCDPKDYPTTKYIDEHPEMYHDPNLTAWDSTNYPKPRNSLYEGC
ncbi:hypothetical protein VKT23_008750 [Stygiomarasmius scandens]|uniref:Glycoside hydrolase family 16 protein n=1 Tax=Marasmiellus scandens TaxID=2682957 RepID=A0ABR1JFH7_9AGAR